MYNYLKYLAFLIPTCMLLTELALRVHNPVYVPIRADKIQLPINRVFTQRNTNNPKVDEFQTYRFNSIGLRGPELPTEPHRFTKIITVGGSTTACTDLTDGRTWPDQLLQNLTQTSNPVWLNNAGQNGHSTFGHLILLEQHLKKFQPDLILYLVGINDLARDDLNSYDARIIGKGESLIGQIVASSELLSTAQVIKRSLLAYDLGVNTLFPIDFEALPTVDIEPDKAGRELALHRNEHLPSYRSRLQELVERTQTIGSQPVFITQPALYGRGTDISTGLVLDNLETPRMGLPSYLEWQILELYNETTRNVAAENGLILIDLAAMLPKDSAYYFDWIHYSNIGAERVADIVAQALLVNQVSPFAENGVADNGIPEG